MIYDKVNRLLVRSETKYGRLTVAIIIAVLLFLAASTYVRPGTNYVGHGASFEALTKNPLDLRNNNAIGYRIMTPLISYAIGLRGRPFIILNLLFAAILIALVYDYFRRRHDAPADALIGATTITFSAVILVTIYYSGFCDALTYLIIFAMWRWKEKSWLFYTLFLVGLFNHESVAFLTPWFIFEKLRVSKRKQITVIELIIGLAVVFSLFFGIRQWLAQGQQIGMDMRFYLSPLKENPLFWINHAFPYQAIGFFTVFKAFWVFPFLAAYAMYKNKDKTLLAGMIILTGCAFSQLLIAYDSTRMLTLGFMVMILGLEYLFVNDTYQIRKWAFPVILFNLFIPQLFTAAKIIEWMQSTPINLIRMVLEQKPWWP